MEIDVMSPDNEVERFCALISEFGLSIRPILTASYLRWFPMYCRAACPPFADWTTVKCKLEFLEVP